jgi:hypothetical protein
MQLSIDHLYLHLLLQSVIGGQRFCPSCQKLDRFYLPQRAIPGFLPLLSWEFFIVLGVPTFFKHFLNLLVYKKKKKQQLSTSSTYSE